MSTINPAQIPKSNFFLSNSFIFPTLCRRRSTFVESPLQIHLFMRNKPNLRKARVNTTSLLTKTYENQTLGSRGKNKPNQTQSAGNSRPKRRRAACPHPVQAALALINKAMIILKRCVWQVKKKNKGKKKNYLFKNC
jgi:hypothetical protein